MEVFVWSAGSSGGVDWYWVIALHFRLEVPIKPRSIPLPASTACVGVRSRRYRVAVSQTTENLLHAPAAAPGYAVGEAREAVLATPSMTVANSGRNMTRLCSHQRRTPGWWNSLTRSGSWRCSHTPCS